VAQQCGEFGKGLRPTPCNDIIVPEERLSLVTLPAELLALFGEAGMCPLLHRVRSVGLRQMRAFEHSPTVTQRILASDRKPRSVKNSRPVATVDDAPAPRRAKGLGE
jgi:hypothetical protein